MCIYRGIKIGALTIQSWTDGETSEYIHKKLYHKLFKKVKLNGKISNVFYFILYIFL